MAEREEQRKQRRLELERRYESARKQKEAQWSLYLSIATCLIDWFSISMTTLKLHNKKNHLIHATMQGLQLDTISRSFFFQIGYTAKKTHGGLWEREQEELRAKREAKQKLEMLQKLALAEEKKALFRQRLQVAKVQLTINCYFFLNLIPRFQLSYKQRCKSTTWGLLKARGSFILFKIPFVFRGATSCETSILMMAFTWVIIDNGHHHVVAEK